MSEEFGPNFITLTDEDGNEIELEYVDAIEVDGQTYMAFFPADQWQAPPRGTPSHAEKPSFQLG